MESNDKMVKLFGHRRSIRLPEYDYSEEGDYIVTILTHHRNRILGEISNGVMKLSVEGVLVQEMIKTLSTRYPRVEVGPYVIMPDHVHIIFTIHDDKVEDGHMSVEQVGGDHVRAIHELPLHKKRVPLQEEGSPLPFPDSESIRVSRRRMLIPLVVGYLKMNTARRINQLSIVKKRENLAS